MDAIKGAIRWPFHTFISYARFSVGVFIVAVPALIHILIRGKKSLEKFDKLYQFLSAYPLGKRIVRI